MSKVQPRTLSGFMELLPARQAQFDRMVEILRRTYGLYGFTPLDTPLIEASEVLLAKGGGETEKQIYRFMKGDTDLSLRFDLTVPLAKYVAQNYGQLTFPFRRFQIGKVYRGERAQRGRFREFYQADIDVIGDGKLDISNEAEIPSIIYKAFTALGLKRFQIRVNNRKILNGFYAMLGLTEQSGDVMRTVDKLDKIGADKVGRAAGRRSRRRRRSRPEEILKLHRHHRHQRGGPRPPWRATGAGTRSLTSAWTS
ncbi:MAG: ATP phosphoribosyltransferase regulatory subunit [Lawsonibacter sp.]